MNRKKMKEFRNHKVDAKVVSVEESFWENQKKNLETTIAMNKMQLEDMPYWIEFNTSVLKLVEEKLIKIKEVKDDGKN